MAEYQYQPVDIEDQELRKLNAEVVSHLSNSLFCSTLRCAETDAS